MPITIGALRESAPGETRVSLVPEVVDKFMAAGARVVLEPGAGTRAQFPDALYKKGEWARQLGRRAVAGGRAADRRTRSPSSRSASSSPAPWWSVSCSRTPARPR